MCPISVPLKNSSKKDYCRYIILLGTQELLV